MFFDFSLTIPHNTTYAQPVSLLCPVSPGVVDRLMLIFPTGCAGLAHVRIYRASHQVWPTNLDGSFASDGEFLDFTENYVLDNEPYAFVLSGWNEDDAYDHTVIVRFNIVALPKDKASSLTDAVRNMLGMTVGR